MRHCSWPLRSFVIKRTMLVSLFQPAYSLLSVISIFLCAVICIADQETTFPSFVIFNHLAVYLRLFQYPVFHFLTFVLYLRTLYATPIVASSFILPPIFSTTITPILPERCLFFLINIVKIPFASPNIR